MLTNTVVSKNYAYLTNVKIHLYQIAEDGSMQSRNVQIKIKTTIYIRQ